MSSCPTCSFPVTGQGLSIAGKSYHQSCFICKRCSQNLAGKPVMEVNGQLHCKNCVDQLKAAQPQQQQQQQQQPQPQQQQQKPAGGCGGCGLPLSGQVVNIGGSNYHANCFRCGRCGQAINGPYGQHNDKPHCKTCLDTLRSQNQQQQQQQQLQQQQQQLQQQQQQLQQQQQQLQQQRPQVKCAQCEGAIQGSYSEYKGHPICPSCTEKLQKGVERPKFLQQQQQQQQHQDEQPKDGPKCTACQGVLFGSVKKVDGKMYHPLCFVCAHCRQPLPGDYKEHNGKPYCDLHYGELFAQFRCAKCNGPIREGDFVDEDNLKFHMDCFRCATCNVSLKNTKFNNKGSTYYCDKCYSK